MQGRTIFNAILHDEHLSLLLAPPSSVSVAVEWQRVQHREPEVKSILLWHHAFMLSRIPTPHRPVRERADLVRFTFIRSLQDSRIQLDRNGVEAIELVQLLERVLVAGLGLHDAADLLLVDYRREGWDAVVCLAVVVDHFSTGFGEFLQIDPDCVQGAGVLLHAIEHPSPDRHIQQELTTDVVLKS